MAPKKIFVGGYTKSGTTFVGRALGLFNNTYAKGEMDYFRLFNKGMSDLVVAYNNNLEVVNREVYDGKGNLEPVTIRTMRSLYDKLFLHLFFNGETVPADCEFIVEKSPRNIFHLSQIQQIFPDSVNICVYREPVAVFRSLTRHMADHRNASFHDPASKQRQALLANMPKRWNRYIDIIEKQRKALKVVQYQRAADDNAAFLDYIEQDIIGKPLGLRAPVETLSKDYYLKSLPEEVRAKSLVQTGPPKIVLSENEIQSINETCRLPGIEFDF